MTRSHIKSGHITSGSAPPPNMTAGTRTAWLRTLALAALVLASGLGIGLLIDQPWPALTVAALGMLAWHYWKLHGVLMRLNA